MYPLLGSQRRRLIPALSLDTPSPVRKPANSTAVRWVDGPLRSAQRGLGEPFEIKVYEIDDVERLQRRRGGTSKVSSLFPTRGQVPGVGTRVMGPRGAGRRGGQGTKGAGRQGGASRGQGAGPGRRPSTLPVWVGGGDCFLVQDLDTGLQQAPMSLSLKGIQA